MPEFIGFENPVFDKEAYMRDVDPVIASMQREIEMLRSAIKILTDKNAFLIKSIEGLTRDKTQLLGAIKRLESDQSLLRAALKEARTSSGD
jgi:hypothetical protein